VTSATAAAETLRGCYNMPRHLLFDPQPTHLYTYMYSTVKYVINRTKNPALLADDGDAFSHDQIQMSLAKDVRTVRTEANHVAAALKQPVSVEHRV